MSPAAGGSAPVIVSVGALCAVGCGIQQIYGSVRAGIGRQSASSVMDRWFEPVTMGLVPEDALEPLADGVDTTGWTSARRRMLRLAAAPLREATAGVPEGTPPLPLFIGLPETRPGAIAVDGAGFARALSAQSGVAVDAEGSKVFPSGRAAALLALEAALECLAANRAGWVLVGGVDTYLDLARLGELDAEGRILGPRVMDGFIPGEGAAFALLTTSRGARSANGHPPVRVLGVGTAQDPGHRYGKDPARGEGLSNALEALLAAAGPPASPIPNTWAGLNGESFGAKEWGVARLRHNDLFTPQSQIEHPADTYGDPGAASGALLLALASTALERGDREGPALVWSSSDREPRACTLLTT